MRKSVYRVLLLDDRPDTLFYILDMLNDLVFIGEPVVISDMEEGLTYIRENEVDILFLDMDFGRTDLDGPLLLGMIAEPPVTIACSSSVDYVFRAEEVGIYKYISKTISFKALERMMHAAVGEVDRSEEARRRNVVTLRLRDCVGREVKLEVAEIYYAQVCNNMVTVYTGEKEFEFKISLKKFSEMLPIDHFSRPHHSYLVALDKVATVIERKVYLEGARSDVQLAVSQECNVAFKHALKLFRQRRNS